MFNLSFLLIVNKLNDFIIQEILSYQYYDDDLFEYRISFNNRHKNKTWINLNLKKNV